MNKENYEKPNIFGLFNNNSKVFGENIETMPTDPPISTPEIGDSEEPSELIDD